MAVSLSSLAGAGWQFFDSNGNPLAGGLLYTYVAGTTTPATTYTSVTGLTANTNPIILDAAGRVPEEVWLTSGVSYKLVLKNSSNVQVWSKDNLSGINDINGATFQYNAPNSVSRTLQSKLQDAVSVADFGADPTGAADSTTAIQNAINYVTSLDGGTLTSPPGATYRLQGSLTLASGVYIDLNGSTLVQYTDNAPIFTAPTKTVIANWGLSNGYLKFNTFQDGTSTVNVTGSTLVAGDIFQGQTSGATGQVVSVNAGVLTYLAGTGTLANGETLSVNSVARATTSSAVTTSKCGNGIRLAHKAFSYQFAIEDLDIIDAYDGIVCPTDYEVVGPTRYSSFAFVGRIQDYTASVARWAINYDCDSAVGANTNVQLVNCWHLHSRPTPAPFSSGFYFNACSQFQWQSILADKIQGQFLFMQLCSGWVGDLSLEASTFSVVPNNSAAAVQFSDSSLSVQTLKYIGNTFNTFNNITVASATGLNVNDIITGATSGASGTVVAIYGTTVTFTQTTSTGFSVGENVQVGGVTKTTVSAASSNSGAVYMFRGTTATYNGSFTGIIDNYVTSGNTYNGQGIYDVVPTTNSVSPAAGYYWVYNTQAVIDRSSMTVNVSSPLYGGNTIVGATSGAIGRVVSLSGSGATTSVTFTPVSGTFTIGENVTVSAAVKGSVVTAPAIAPQLADFAAIKSIRLWSGDNRYYTTGMMADNYSAALGTGSWNFTNPNSSAYAKDLTGTVVPYGNSQKGGLTLQSWTGSAYTWLTKIQLRTDGGGNPRLSIVGPDNAYASVEVVTANGSGVETVRGTLTDPNGNFIWGTAALATSATNGFPWIPSCAGAPTGAPTAPYTDAAAMVVDTTNSRLYVRVGNTWKYAALV